MHYFDEHIGDTFLAVGTMPLVCHGIYARLKARYFSREAPLPNKPVLLREWSGVHTRAERGALERVLEECFLLDEDECWRVPKWDEQIATFKAKQAAAVESEVAQQAKSNSRVRLLRVERRLMTAALVDIECRKKDLDDLGMKELRALAVQKLGQERVDTIAAEATAAVSETAGETPAVTPVKRGETPPHEPGTASQKPPHTLQYLGEETGGVGGGETKAETTAVTPAVTAAVTPLRGAFRPDTVMTVAAELTAKGLLVHHTDTDLQKLVAAGWDATAIQAQKPKGGWDKVKFPMAWLVGKLENKAAGGVAVPAPESGASTGGWPETRSGVERVGVELGLGSWDEAAFYACRGESFKDYEARVKRAAGRDAEAVA
jgi:uncharacterized protein YdaU (DUF1376 family)